MIIGEDMAKDSIKNSSTSSGSGTEKTGKAFSNKVKVELIRNILFGDGGKKLKKELGELSKTYKIDTDSFNNLNNELSVINLELLLSLLPSLEKIKQKTINEIGYSKFKKQLEKSQSEVDGLKEKLNTISKYLK
jgi:hypothetical protein